MYEYLNKADWISLYGSEELKERWHLSEGKYSFIDEYLRERLAYEYPGFIIYGINPKVEDMDLAGSWFTDDYEDLKFLIKTVPTKAKLIISNEAPSLNALKLAQSYDCEVEVKLLQSINIAASYHSEYSGWLECLYIDSWLGLFIICKPIAPSEKKAASTSQKTSSCFQSLKTFIQEEISEIIGWSVVGFVASTAILIAIAYAIN